MNRTRTALLPFAIFLLGLALRLYRLGDVSFWLDEAGVALAARAETLGGMLSVVRSHVLAMPLDYLIVWLVGRVNTSEFALRLPAVLWGSFSLLLAYALYRRFLSRTPALLGMLILALAPLHIQYSQELRFYASLVFFYLLATLLLWDAVQQPTVRRWALFTLAAVVGVYFHPYVLLCLANGAVWLAQFGFRGALARTRRLGLIASGLVILLAFLAGYVTFSASNTFAIPLMAMVESPVAAILAGLGWLPYYTAQPGWDWLWGLLLAVLTITGAVLLFRQGPRLGTAWFSPAAGLLVSAVLQMAAILLSDVAGHYFFAPRQWIFLLPALCMAAGAGAAAVADAATGAIRPRSESARATGYLLAALVLILAAVPAIRGYQQDDKGASRAVVENILREWQPGSSVLVYPAYEGYVYKYYLDFTDPLPEAAGRVWGATWDLVKQAGKWDNPVYVITPARLRGQEVDDLHSIGYEPVFSSNPQSRYAKTLWRKP